MGSNGQWDMMTPQKGNVSGDLSSGSSVYQLNSKPTGKRSGADLEMKSPLRFTSFFLENGFLEKISPRVPVLRHGDKMKGSCDFIYRGSIVA